MNNESNSKAHLDKSRKQRLLDLNAGHVSAVEVGKKPFAVNGQHPKRSLKK